MKGKVIKGIGGFYFVKYGNEVIRGQGRGKLKKSKNLIKIGDIVEYDLRPDGECIITKVCNRKNEFYRPAISNIDKLIVTFAIKAPNPNYISIDKLCVISEYYNVPVIICINKIDLADEKELKKVIDMYETAYDVVTIDALHGKGIDSLMKKISGNTVALVGPSGVGKSTILNSILPDEKIETGEISMKNERGKHTTRHAEIFSINENTNIFDTPGFTSLDLPVFEVSKLRKLFPEFEKYDSNCKFNDCMHINEPICGVKEALNQGLVDKSRYRSYIVLKEELDKLNKY